MSSSHDFFTSSARTSPNLWNALKMFFISTSTGVSCVGCMHPNAAIATPSRLGYLQGVSVQPDVSGFVVHFIIDASSLHTKQCCFGVSFPVMKVLSREH